jgi:2-polyprenyl-3-methyl-5-hydroxy-6-metoxy-1,4-benzoquinol methylase
LGHSHEHSHGDSEPPEEIRYTREFWDERYGSADRLWSGNPNPQLVAQADGLAPGTALDAGCGEGADAIWLAAKGWTVTAVDVSQVAIDRGARQAAAAGDEVAARIGWQREDLQTWDPGPDRFDLVSAQFMHFPSPTFEEMCGRLARAVRPGGTLLVPGQVVALLDPASWKIAVADKVRRPATDLDGQPVTLTDTVVRASRTS